MGINNFVPYIKKTYRSACKESYNVIYDNLYIDVNYVLHHVCYYSSDIKDLLKRFKDYLHNIITNIKPKKRLFLCADGVAPLAKMLLQRKRRHTIINTTDIQLNLTPGTRFMMTLENELYGFIQYVKTQFNIDVITDIINEGEGEIKIKFHLLEYHKLYPNDVHMVYSGDSDMVLLLFTCDDLTKIYHMITKDTIIHYGTMYEQHILMFGSAKHDFVFINLLLGNDYIPKVALLKLETIWESYKNALQFNPSGLITFNNTQLQINQLFIYDLLYYVIKKRSIKPLSLDIINTYKNYVQGLYWCACMYYTGKCTDYKYIFDTKLKPCMMGIMWYIMYNNKYTIVNNPSIPTYLYGILLIPHKIKHILSDKQNIIASKLTQKYPIIYSDSSLSTTNIDNIVIEYNNIIGTICMDEIICNNTEIYSYRKIICLF